MKGLWRGAQGSAPAAQGLTSSIVAEAGCRERAALQEAVLADPGMALGGLMTPTELFGHRPAAAAGVLAAAQDGARRPSAGDWQDLALARRASRLGLRYRVPKPLV